MNGVNKWRVNHVLESNIRNYVRNLIHEAMEAGFSVQDLKNELTNDLQGVKDQAEYRVKINHFLKGGYDYCVKMLGEPIGNGSSRAVFQIDDTRVLKLATNIKGVAQNKAEVTAYHQSPIKTFMPIIYNDSDMENYFYVISEYVLPANEEDFKNLLGVPFYIFKNIILDSMVIDNEIEHAMEKYKDLPTVYTLLQYILTMSKSGVNINDWVNISNWGLTMRNGKPTMVTLDNGYTRNVAKLFYHNKNVFNGEDDTIGVMMGYDDNYYHQLEKKFSEILPKDTLGKDIIIFAYHHSNNYYKHMIEDIYKSNFQDKDMISDLIYDYIDIKYPNFDWKDNKTLPKYAYESVAEWIKKLYSNINK